MNLRAALLGFLGWILYPAWLLAGAADYCAHRRTDIAHTSGATESWLHVAQLLCIAAAFVPAIVLEITMSVWVWMLGAVLLHSALAYVDVRYTQARRYIAPFEQFVHGFLNVIPLVAVAILGVLHWPQLAAGAPGVMRKATADDTAARMLLWSFAVLAGIPVLEELIRALRARAGMPAGPPAIASSRR